MTLFIGLSGKKQVGKDTAAKIMTSILHRRGLRAATTAFADALKDMCVDVLGIPHEGAYGSDEDKNQPSHILWDTLPLEIRREHALDTEEDLRSGPMTNREVLQIVGTDIFRNMLYYSVWVDVPFRRDWDADVVIVTDVRFPNEAEAVEKNGGVVLRLTRDTGFEGDVHASEVALDGAQFEFNYANNGTIADLGSYLDNFLENVTTTTSEA